MISYRSRPRDGIISGSPLGLKKEKRNFPVAGGGGGGGFILSLLNDYYELDANRHDTETNFKPKNPLAV